MFPMVRRLRVLGSPRRYAWNGYGAQAPKQASPNFIQLFNL
jgi:hypothetical protein